MPVIQIIAVEYESEPIINLKLQEKINFHKFMINSRLALRTLRKLPLNVIQVVHNQIEIKTMQIKIKALIKMIVARATLILTIRIILTLQVQQITLDRVRI